MDPKILGGDPVITGTRIPIERVYHLVRQGESVDGLLSAYPQVKPKTINYIISYLMQMGLNEYEKTQKVKASA